MNRAEIARAAAACDAMAKKLREALVADARNEYDEHGTVPTWRLPGMTVSGRTTTASVAISDEGAFDEWAEKHYPSEIERVFVVRAKGAWLAAFLKGVAARGEPLCDKDGAEVSGLSFRPGGEFDGIAVKVDSDVKEMFADYAAEITAGLRPLALPPVVAQAVS